MFCSVAVTVKVNVNTKVNTPPPAPPELSDTHKMKSVVLASCLSRRGPLKNKAQTSALDSDLLHIDTPFLPFQSFAYCLPIACQSSSLNRDLAFLNISRNAKRALHYVSRNATSAKQLPVKRTPSTQSKTKATPLPLTIVQQLLNAPAPRPFQSFAYCLPAVCSPIYTRSYSNLTPTAHSFIANSCDSAVFAAKSVQWHGCISLIPMDFK